MYESFLLIYLDGFYILLGSFCTPGMCMTLFSTLANCSVAKIPTLSDIEDAFDGNLCRCTGYRPILDVAKKSFAEKEITQGMIIDFPKELAEEYRHT